MNKLLREKFGRSLQNIFNHYVDMAGRRHIQDVVAEKMRAQAVQQRLDQHGLGRGTVAHEKMKQGTNLPQSPVRKLLKNRQTIGHKEFFQVCIEQLVQYIPRYLTRFKTVQSRFQIEIFGTVVSYCCRRHILDCGSTE